MPTGRFGVQGPACSSSLGNYPCRRIKLELPLTARLDCCIKMDQRQATRQMIRETLGTRSGNGERGLTD